MRTRLILHEEIAAVAWGSFAMTGSANSVDLLAVSESVAVRPTLVGGMPKPSNADEP